MGSKTTVEGSLEAPTRHPLDWKSSQFYDRDDLYRELERVYDICHGCRRCVSLCHAFPTLFDLVDESETMEVDGVSHDDYMKVVDQCYLCDLCFLTKCPYVPPHEWNVDFPHLMLRAKAFKFKTQGARFRDRLLSSTDRVGRLAGIPVIVNFVNAVNRGKTTRRITQAVLGIDADAPLPAYHRQTFRRQYDGYKTEGIEAQAAAPTRGRVVLFSTCYGNYNEPEIAEDLLKVFEHNRIQVKVLKQESCCGMPKLELGDLESVEKLKQQNIATLARWVEAGWDIVTPVPSCTLMYKQELPLLFAGDEQVALVQQHCFDPFEYLSIRHKAGLLVTDFPAPLGKLAYHPACHQRVQRIGPKTKELLELAGAEVTVVERCSGHDGTYAVKREFRPHSVKIGRPAAKKIAQAGADYYTSDCPMAGHHLESILADGSHTTHPMRLLRIAYGIS